MSEFILQSERRRNSFVRITDSLLNRQYTALRNSEIVHSCYYNTFQLWWSFLGYLQIGTGTNRFYIYIYTQIGIGTNKRNNVVYFLPAPLAPPSKHWDDCPPICTFRFCHRPTQGLNLSIHQEPTTPCDSSGSNWLIPLKKRVHRPPALRREETGGNGDTIMSRCVLSTCCLACLLLPWGWLHWPLCRTSLGCSCSFEVPIFNLYGLLNALRYFILSNMVEPSQGLLRAAEGWS